MIVASLETATGAAATALLMGSEALPACSLLLSAAGPLAFSHAASESVAAAPRSRVDLMNLMASSSFRLRNGRYIMTLAPCPLPGARTASDRFPRPRGPARPARRVARRHSGAAG